MTPLPIIDADSRPFWDGCNQGVLLGQCCGSCGLWRWPPRGYCPDCHAQAPQWRRLSGEGKVIGYAVAHRAFDPAFADQIPLTIVHVELDGTDGRMVLVSNLQRHEWCEVQVGDRVEVKFHRLNDEVVLPKFTLAAK